MALTYIGPAEVQDMGGEAVALRSDTPWPPGAKLRMQVVRLLSLSPAVFEVVAECLNGQPGERTTDGPTTVYLLAPEPDLPDDDESATPRARVDARAYLPRLATGVYYLRLLRYLGVVIGWSSYGDAGPVRVLPCSRFAETYSLRSRFPANYPAGPRQLADEPLAG